MATTTASTSVSTKVEIPVSALPQSAPSICIPYVFSNISWGRVKGVFEKLELGEIDRVDMVKKTNDKGEKFQRVFVHFKCWSTADQAQQVRQKLLNGDEVKIVHDEPWFWKVSMSKVARPEFDAKVGGEREREHKPTKRVTGPRTRVDLRPSTTSTKKSTGGGGSAGAGARRGGGHATDTATAAAKSSPSGAEMGDLFRMVQEQQQEIQRLKEMVQKRGTQTQRQGKGQQSKFSPSKKTHPTTQKPKSTRPHQASTKPKIELDASASGSASGWGVQPDTAVYASGWGDASASGSGWGVGVQQQQGDAPVSVPAGSATPTYDAPEDTATTPVYSPTTPAYSVETPPYKPQSPVHTPEELKIRIPE
jgi:hypothetical protein